MPALLNRVSRRMLEPEPEQATPTSGAVASILANLEPGLRDDGLSRREFRELVIQRAQSAERQVWQPLRFAARSRGDW